MAIRVKIDAKTHVDAGLFEEIPGMRFTVNENGRFYFSAIFDAEEMRTFGRDLERIVASRRVRHSIQFAGRIWTVIHADEETRDTFDPDRHPTWFETLLEPDQARLLAFDCKLAAEEADELERQLQEEGARAFRCNDKRRAQRAFFEILHRPDGKLDS